MKRTLSDWAAIAEIVASVAVVVSLVFVGLQIQRNTTEIQAAQSNDLYDSLREIELAVLSSPEVVEAYTKVVNGRRAELTASELAVYEIYLMQSFTIWEQAHARWKDGSMSEKEYLGWKKLFAEYIRQMTIQRDIDYMLPWFTDPDFVAEVSELNITAREQ